MLFSSADDHIWALAERTGTFYGIKMKARHIYAVAGGGGKLGSGVPATSVDLGIVTSEHYSGLLVAGLRIDHQGNIVVTDFDHAQIRVVADRNGTFYGQQMTAGHIYTVAGTGETGETGDGGPAGQAEIDAPAGVAADSVGDVLITTNCEIRVLAAITGTHYGIAMTAGDIYSIAGSTTCAGSDASESADGSPAASAELTHVGTVLVDSAGNVLFSDDAGVHVVASATGTFYRQPMTAGDLYTVASPAPGGFAIDGSGNLVLVDTPDDTLSLVAETTGDFYGRHFTAGQTARIAGDDFLGHTGDGGPALLASMAQPVGVVARVGGNLDVAEYHWIRQIAG